MSKNWIEMLQRLAGVAFFLIIMMVILSAVEKKQASNSREVIVDIEALNGDKFLINEADVRTLIERSFGYNLEGLPIGALNVERLERVLEEDPFVSNADVFVDAKNTVKIKLKQREPILRIMDKNGLRYYLDRVGNKLPLSSHYSARVLVATGNIPPHIPDFLDRRKHILKDLFELTHIILEDPFLLAQVEQIHISNNAEFTLVPKVGDHKIILGSYTDVMDKLNRLKNFYHKVLPYKGWQRYNTINLKFKQQVVCK